MSSMFTNMIAQPRQQMMESKNTQRTVTKVKHFRETMFQSRSSQRKEGRTSIEAFPCRRLSNVHRLRRYVLILETFLAGGTRKEVFWCIWPDDLEAYMVFKAE